MEISKEKENNEYIIIETATKAGSSDLIRLWVIIEPKYKEVLVAEISKKRNMFVAERLLSQAVNESDYILFRQTVVGIWYSTSMQFLNLYHHIFSSFEKSLIERTMQYIKVRTESFDDYFPRKKHKCKLHHKRQWLKLFVYEHNKEIMS